jgi:hypothetical protein
VEGNYSHNGEHLKEKALYHVQKRHELRREKKSMIDSYLPTQIAPIQPSPATAHDNVFSAPPSAKISQCNAEKDSVEALQNKVRTAQNKTQSLFVQRKEVKKWKPFSLPRVTGTLAI